MTKEALKLALEALQKIYIAPEHEEYIRVWWPACEQAIIAIKEALAQPEQEPVAVVRWNDIGHISWRTHVMLSDDTPLYTTPPQRTWVGLTDKDWNRSKHNYDFQKGADWAESILKEKNT